MLGELYKWADYCGVMGLAIGGFKGMLSGLTQPVELPSTGVPSVLSCKYHKKLMMIPGGLGLRLEYARTLSKYPSMESRAEFTNLREGFIQGQS